MRPFRVSGPIAVTKKQSLASTKAKFRLDTTPRMPRLTQARIAHTAG